VTAVVSLFSSACRWFPCSATVSELLDWITAKAAVKIATMVATTVNPVVMTCAVDVRFCVVTSSRR
jgi:hypothetical protein